MKIFALKTVGYLSLTLGALGAFLPLLPSTCFILLASWAFSKSSPHFHTWLTYRSPFALSIQNWQQHRIVPKKIKWLASVSMLASFTITAWIAANPIVIVSLAIGMTFLLGYLLTRDSEVNQTMHRHNHELYPPVY